LRANFFPLSSLANSWRTPRSVSSPAPLNPTRVKCNWVGTNGLKDGRDTSGEWGGDAKPRQGESYTKEDINLLCISYLFACLLQCNFIPFSCPSNWIVVRWIPLRPKNDPSLSQLSKYSNLYSLKSSNTNAPSLTNRK
jgi:hypothetical protein